MSAEHWGRRPRDWAVLAEPDNHPLFVEVLGRLGIGSGSELLDVGCGAGYAAGLATSLGARVTGIDITPELLEIARERVPAATFVAGDMDCLPFANASFSDVVMFNALPFAEDPQDAVAECVRVVRPAGRLAISVLAEAERNESTALHASLEPLRARATRHVGSGHRPYELSAGGSLQRIMRTAGLEELQTGEVQVIWGHPTVDESVRAVLASGGGAMAIEAAGEAATRTALEQAVQPFVAPDGSVTMRNVLRFAIGRRPARN